MIGVSQVDVARRARTAVASVFPISVRWPAWARAHPVTLQLRLVLLTAAAVAMGVLLSGTALFLTTRASMYDQLDNELTQLAAFMADRVTEDQASLGGLNVDALRAANVTMVLVQANKGEVRVQGDTATFPITTLEIAIARTQSGYAARTGYALDGTPYRIVTVPLTSGGRATTAVVLGRSLTPTLATLNNMWAVLAGVGVVGVALAVLFGWLVARSTLQPIRRLTTAVTYITDTDELVPIEIEGETELSDLSHAFNSMVYSLASSRERQKRLIADAGHELRTPLTSLRTNIELLIADERTGMLPEGARSDILRDIAAQLGEFTALVGDLVHLSREGRAQAAREPVDMRDIVANAITRARRRGPNLRFEVDLEPLFLIGEPDTLERAFTNLLDNAVKFSPSGGTVRVLMQGDQIRISDEGPGIADEDLPHIFERFYRSDRARNTPGTGLGLSIVAHTINSHGGWVKAGHAKPGGAEFTVMLPGVTDPADLAGADAAALEV